MAGEIVYGGTFYFFLLNLPIDSQVVEIMNGSKVGTLRWAIGNLMIAFLFCLFGVKLIRAYHH